MKNLQYYTQKLCSFPHRGIGTKYERKAAKLIFREFKKMGYEPKIQKFQTVPWGLSSMPLIEMTVYFTFLLSVILILSKNVSLAVAFFALGIFLFITQYSGIVYKLLVKIYSIKSQNVFVEKLPQGKAQKTIVILGHYDTARANIGLKIIKPLAAKLSFKAKKFPPFLRTPLFLSNLAIFLTCFLFVVPPSFVERLIGMIAIFIFALTIFILLSVFFSSYVPGALDNASGAAVVMTLASFFSHERMKNTRLIFLTPGAEESPLHGVEFFPKDCPLDKKTTFFVNLDGVGGENLTIANGESDGIGLSWMYDRDLFALIEKTKNRQFPEVKVFYVPVGSDCEILVRKGFRVATMFNSLGNNGYYDHYHQMTDTIDKVNFKTMALCKKFTVEIIREIDESGAL